MPNKRYSDDMSDEPGGKAERVEHKGKMDTSGAKFKPLSTPNSNNAQDQEEFGGFGKVKVDTKMPGEPKSLPQVKGKE